MLVHDFLAASARNRPAKAGLVCGGQRFTYAYLEVQANRLAWALLARGVQRGDRVLVHLPNGPAAAAAIFGALKAGAVFVPVNPGVKADKLNFILNDCRATALLTELDDACVPQTPWLRVVVNCGPEKDSKGQGEQSTREHANGNVALLNFAEVQTQGRDECPPPVNHEEDLACLIYTSGSTGRPKGVMSEHRNVVFAAGSIIHYLENTEDDVVLNALPFSFDYGLYQMLMTFRFGGTLVLEKSFSFPSMILRRIAEERVTGLPGVPTLFSLLFGMDLGAYDLSSLRYLTNTAAALPPTHALELRRKFPHARLYSMYGLTETKRALYLPPDELERRPGSVGIPIPGTEAWIEDDHGQLLGAGQVGELVIRGPHVMRGYWGDPQASARRFRPGPIAGERLCYTGDLFRRDAEGFFYFVGRTDDIIKSRGEKVAPKEVEEVLYKIPGVVEAAVVGVPDAILGQRLKAFVACRVGELSSLKVLAHCRAHLEEFMVPKEVEIRESLPKNASGKIDKLALNPKTPEPAVAPVRKTVPLAECILP